MQIVNAAGDLAKAEKRRALTKVMEPSDRASEWSEPMRNTPRKRRFEHALRGFWPRFPVSPEPYEEEIGSHFQSRDFYPERASFGLSRTLDRYVDQAEKLLEVRQVRRGPGPPPGVDDRRHRTDGATPTTRSAASG